MSATTSSYLPASTQPWEGDAGSFDLPPDGTDAGAAGTDTSSMSLSTGALIAIIVIVLAVIVIGVVTATLFFIAKKREWTMKETIKRSSRKVIAALTPRRSEFPREVKNSMRSSSRKGRTKLNDDVPPTPRLRPEDLEKGLAKVEIKPKPQTPEQK